MGNDESAADAVNEDRLKILDDDKMADRQKLIYKVLFLLLGHNYYE